MNAKQRALARDAEAKLLAALDACDTLAEYERTNAVTVRVAFTQLPAERIARWQANLNEIEAGKRTAQQ